MPVSTTRRSAILTTCGLALLPLAAIPKALAAGPRTWKQDRFLVTFWCPPPATDEALRTVAADGYNLTWTPESGLDTARKHGLKAMLQDSLLAPETLEDPAKRARLEALVDRVKTHPALEAYYIIDEPSAAAFPGLGRLVAFLRERDPAHFAYINLFPTYANNQQLGTTGDTVTAYREHLRRYVDEVRPALISYDHYHFFKERDGDQYFLNLGMIRDAALTAGVPFLNIIQACTIEKVWRLVNADELRFLVYTTLAYGGRGLSYFLHTGPIQYGGLYQDGVRMPLADAVAALNRELAVFGPEMLRLHSVGVHHTAPLPRGTTAIPADSPVQIDGVAGCVLGLFATAPRPGSRVTAFLVANRDYRNPSRPVLRLGTGVRRVEELDRATGKWTRRTDYRRGQPWTLDLAAADGRLFRFR